METSITREAAEEIIASEAAGVADQAILVLARRVEAARDALYDAESDLDFATDDDNVHSRKYSPQYDRQVVVFENPERTRIIEVQIIKD